MYVVFICLQENHAFDSCWQRFIVILLVEKSMRYKTKWKIWNLSTTKKTRKDEALATMMIEGECSRAFTICGCEESYEIWQCESFSTVLHMHENVCVCVCCMAMSMEKWEQIAICTRKKSQTNCAHYIHCFCLDGFVLRCRRPKSHHFVFVCVSVCVLKYTFYLWNLLNWILL